MANNDCLPQVQGCALRLAYLDPNGVPTPGAGNLYTSDALSEATMTPVYEDAEEITEKSACEKVIVNYQGPPTLKRGDLEIKILTPDPYLMQFLGGGDVLSDSGINGFAYPPIGTVVDRPISIEIWAKRIDDGEIHAEYPYAWWVLPWVARLRHGPRVWNNGAWVPTFNAQLYENENWFDGPLNDWVVESDRFAQWFPTDSLPTVACGPTAIAAS